MPQQGERLSQSWSHSKDLQLLTFDGENPYNQLRRDESAHLEMINFYQGWMNHMVSGVFTFRSQLLMWICAQASALPHNPQCIKCVMSITKLV